MTDHHENEKDRFLLVFGCSLLTLSRLKCIIRRLMDISEVPMGTKIYERYETPGSVC